MNCKKDNFLKTEYLKNEKIQIFIRLIFIVVVAISIYLYKIFYPDSITYNLSYIMMPPLLVFSLNILYAFVIKYFPYRFQIQRITFSVLLDIGLTVYVMYLVNTLASYYAGVLLWFTVAYGMRYSKKIAYTAYFSVLISWSFLITTSDFWMEHKSFAIGWLLAYIVLPLYYFKLVDKLHENLQKVHYYAEESKYKALHDRLTGLSNRALFDEELREYIKAYTKKEEKFALFFTDLDSFKEINDAFGHDVGDRVLVEASKRLKSVIKNTYRLGGDEFVSILKYRDESELQNRAKSLLFHLTMPCKEKRIVLSGSLGIARFPFDAQTEFEIKKRADLAMYAAKQAGKNRYYFYEEVVA